MMRRISKGRLSREGAIFCTSWAYFTKEKFPGHEFQKQRESIEYNHGPLLRIPAPPHRIIIIPPCHSGAPAIDGGSSQVKDHAGRVIWRWLST